MSRLTRGSEMTFRLEEFTPIEKKILDILSDGIHHGIDELFECIDELSNRRSIHPHLVRIRKKLKGKGETILCIVRNRRHFYIHVRLLNSPYDGRI
jgi:hypothetical protein